MAYNLPPGCRDSDIDRAFGGADDYDSQVLELNSWHAKHQKAIDDECDRRQAEIDAWYNKATSDLEAEYRDELEKIEPSERDPDADRADWLFERDR